MRKSGPSIVGLNVSHLFNRELLVYSFGDIRLSKPISLKRVMWTAVGFIIWSAPLFLIFGAPSAIWLWVVFLVPPLVFGFYVTKPVFGGKSLFEWVKTQYRFIAQPKGWSDLVADNDQEETEFFIESEISISRRREKAILSKVIRQAAEKERQDKTKGK